MTPTKKLPEEQNGETSQEQKRSTESEKSFSSEKLLEKINLLKNDYQALSDERNRVAEENLKLEIQLVTTKEELAVAQEELGRKEKGKPWIFARR